MEIKEGTVVMDVQEFMKLFDKQSTSLQNVTCDGWIDLRKEIDTYIRSSVYGIEGKGDGLSYNPAYSGWVNAIHLPIKLALNLRYIHEMKEEQVPIAREIFEIIKKRREEQLIDVNKLVAESC